MRLRNGPLRTLEPLSDWPASAERIGVNASCPRAVPLLRTVNDTDGLTPSDPVSIASLEDAARAAKIGGRREMDGFLDALRPLVCRWAVVWTGSADIAEDVAQSVLLRVHRSLESFESGRVTTWAYKITRNVLLDLERMSIRERRRRDGFAEILQLGESRDGVLEVMAQEDLLSRFMSTLSPQQRAALDLVAIQGFTQAEAAEMLDVSIATLRVHLHRARLAMRAQASENEHAEGV